MRLQDFDAALVDLDGTLVDTDRGPVTDRVYNDKVRR